MTKHERKLTVLEVADEMGVTPRSVVHWIDRGQLKAKKPGKMWVVTETALQEFRDSREGKKLRILAINAPGGRLPTGEKASGDTYDPDAIFTWDPIDKKGGGGVKHTIGFPAGLLLEINNMLKLIPEYENHVTYFVRDACHHRLKYWEAQGYIKTSSRYDSEAADLRLENFLSSQELRLKRIHTRMAKAVELRDWKSYDSYVAEHHGGLASWLKSLTTT
jgi:excisionase family DNA binding protein